MTRNCTCPRARHEHGSIGAYQRDRCRCLRCRMAKHYAIASYAAGETWRESEEFVPRVRMRMQLRSLMALGYTARQVSERCGLTTAHVQNLRNDRAHPRVSPRIEAAVNAAYDQMWDTPAVGPHANRQRTKARHNGYLLPMAWDDDTIDDPEITNALHYTDGYPHMLLPAFIDDVAVDEVIGGRRVPLTRAERSEVVSKMTAMGASAERIAERLGVTERSVVRRRAA